ncbi:MAG: nitroreductase family deazaflavin-dependent oxidoreductase [Acidimicrobiales bacterium]|jgi:deazaflavin-dependent oxidoreductase (nitroreductase family)|nr:nitroreductase family deazaflavin-dependent oxidoreductase [Acidimicrobiales bacterium]
MTDVTDWNRSIIEEFRTNDGKVGGPFAGVPVLLLHHTGAKTGTERVNPLAYQAVGDDLAVFASKGGSPTNPDWYHNLRANPRAKVEVGTESYDVVAHVAEGDERERIWSTQKERHSGFAEYEEKTKGVRDIPVIILRRA